MEMNPEITILLPAHNAEDTTGDALQSILDQRFVRYEVLIFDLQSSDRTRETVRRFEDSRFLLLPAMTYTEAMNMGVRQSRGKYIACMNPREMMHPDRLSIQYATLEAEPSIAMCSTGYALVKDRTQVGKGTLVEHGRIQYPLFSFLVNPVFMESSVMTRKSFLVENGLGFKSVYPGCESLFLWVEMAKRNAVFFVDPRQLVLHRSEDRKLVFMEDEALLKDSFLSLRMDLLENLLTIIDSPEVRGLYHSFLQCVDADYMGIEDCLRFMYGILWKNKQSLYPKHFNL